MSYTPHKRARVSSDSLNKVTRLLLERLAPNVSDPLPAFDASTSIAREANVVRGDEICTDDCYDAEDNGQNDSFYDGYDGIQEIDFFDFGDIDDQTEGRIEHYVIVA